ncbi:hypothetical protein FOA52_007439 [Chlamydomonas sp. UWO 241]|nr:hypothetical protein FOA52_007439 [Chlamydomonas sp. UWO 241]
MARDGKSSGRGGGRGGGRGRGRSATPDPRERPAREKAGGGLSESAPPAKRPPPLGPAPGDEEAFPRGGNDGLTHLERRAIEEEARVEFEAEVAAGAGGKKKGKKSDGKKRKSGDGDGDGDGDGGGDEGQGKLPRFVEMLKAKQLAVGMRVWGVVLEVAPHGLTVSLPHGLRGHVGPEDACDAIAAAPAKKKKGEKEADGDCSSVLVCVDKYVISLLCLVCTGAIVGPEDVCDVIAAAPAKKKKGKKEADAPAEPSADLSKLFHVGQYVRCAVIGTPSPGGAVGPGGTPGGAGVKKGLALSLRLSKVCSGLSGSSLIDGAVVPGVVRSAEDHGYTLDLGVKGVSGFLKRGVHEAAFGTGSALLSGMLLEVAVTGCGGAGARVVQVSTDPSLVSSAVLKESEGTSLEALLPGSLVSCKVRAVLADGLLVTFLTFFHGTIDPFHLTAPLTAANEWRRGYSEGQKLRARILYVDPVAKSCGLSLLPHLASLTLPSPTPMLGQLFEAALVRRVHPGLGLLLELPMEGDDDSGSSSCSGFVHISNVTDGREDAPLEKSFKAGQSLKARVIGFRLVDGLATLSMKQSVVDHEVVSYASLHPGMALSAVVTAVEDYGILVSCGPGVKGLVPRVHASDLGTAKAMAKYKVGAKVAGRVLEVNSASRKMTLTLKPGLLGSKLQPLVGAQQAVPGLRAHGVVTGVTAYGVFVQFYGGLGGLAHKAELGLADGAKPASAYTVGQTIKAIVLSVEPATGRLRLGVAGKKSSATAATAGVAGAAAGADALGGLQPGDVATATVKEIIGDTSTPSKVSYILTLTAASGATAAGRLEAPHLGDHPAGAEALRIVLRVGSSIGSVVVLSRQEGKCCVVSRKASLVAAAAQLPSTFGDVAQGTLLPGFVASVTGDAVFVRFLGGVTGRAGLSQLGDTLVSDPKRVYSEGQSVRAQVVTVDAEKSRFSLTLKPTLTNGSGGSAGAYLSSLLADLETAAALKAEQETDDVGVEWGGIVVGGPAKGSVHEQADYGLVVDLEAHADLVGIVRPHQRGELAAQPGAPVVARVLDVSKREGIVDLSATAEHQAAAKGKGAKAAAAAMAKLKVGDMVEAVVELIKELGGPGTGGYAVVSLPGHGNALGFAATTAFNQASPDSVSWRPQLGQRLPLVTVAALPSTSTGGRLLLAAPLTAAKGGGGGGGGGGAPVKAVPGSIVSGVVSSVHDSHVDVSVGKKLTCRLHVCELEDVTGDGKPGAGPVPRSNPLAVFIAQQPVECVVLGRLGDARHRHNAPIDVSVRPSRLAAARVAGGAGGEAPKVLLFEELTPGAVVSGVVSEVAEDHVWVSLSPAVRGRVAALDASNDPAVLSNLCTAFAVGQVVCATVVQAIAKNHQVDLSLVGSTAASPHSSDPTPGSTLTGRVVAVSGAGLRVALPGKRTGTIALTDMHDTWVPNALEGVVKGAYVRVKVLPKASQMGAGTATDGTPLLRLTARPAHGGGVSGVAQGDATSAAAAPAKGKKRTAAAAAAAVVADSAPESVDAGSLVFGSRAVGPKGLFLALDRTLDARIRLGNLSDGFVEDPSAAFPLGMKLTGMLVSTKDDKFELSLRTLDPSAAQKPSLSLEDITVGQTVGGKVRRVENFGVFVDIAGLKKPAGLVHVSELADGDKQVKDVHALYRIGQAVRARVLRVDVEGGKLSLGMKPSYFEGEEEGEAEEGDGKRARIAVPDMDGEAADLEMEEAEEPAVSDTDKEESSDDGSDDGEGDEDEEGAAVNVDDMEDDSEAESEDGSEDGEDDEGSSDEDEGEEEEEEEGRQQPGETSGRSGAELMDVDDAADDDDGLPAWGGLKLADEEGDKAADNGDKAGAKKSKGSKKKEADARERAIRESELSRLHGEAAPTTASDFERLCASSPNSSFVWIKYMAFLISSGDVEAARAVADKAIAKIQYSMFAWLKYKAFLISSGDVEAARAVADKAIAKIQYRLTSTVVEISLRGSTRV